MSLQFLETALLNPNVLAFMRMLAKSEGTDYPDGYTFLFGSKESNTRRFTDFSHHPHINEPFGGESTSSAAGKWQILYPTWVAIQKKYNLPDFSPSSQDLACVELISERNVLQKLMDGDFESALVACSNIWASLPFNSFGQPTHPIGNYKMWYTQAGGIISSLT